MNKLLIIFSFLLSFSLFAQTKEPADEHKKLSAIVGKWTVQGMEDSFLEICEMYPGGYFLVCNSEFKTESRGLNTGVSILGYSTENNHLTYYHYSSTGASQTLKGSIDEDGSLYFEGEEILDGKLTRTRVTMKKIGETYDFKEETSIEDGDWITSANFVYIRAKQ